VCVFVCVCACVFASSQGAPCTQGHPSGQGVLSIGHGTSMCKTNVPNQNFCFSFVSHFFCLIFERSMMGSMVILESPGTPPCSLLVAAAASPASRRQCVFARFCMFLYIFLTCFCGFCGFLCVLAALGTFLGGSDHQKPPAGSEKKYLH
jgi:hypothetical protein